MSVLLSFLCMGYNIHLESHQQPLAFQAGSLTDRNQTFIRKVEDQIQHFIGNQTTWLYSNK